MKMRLTSAWAYVYNVLSNVVNDTDIAQEAAEQGHDPEKFQAALYAVMDEIRRRGQPVDRERAAGQATKAGR